MKRRANFTWYLCSFLLVVVVSLQLARPVSVLANDSQIVIPKVAALPAISGKVIAWGGNTHGQIDVPLGLTDVIAISAGDSHSLALKSDGTVVAWGGNYYGQTNVPPGLTGVIAVSAGLTHSLALKSDGTVVAWGGNYYGESEVPDGLSGVIAIDAAEGGYNLILKSDSTVLGWPDHEATRVPGGLRDVIAISGGSGCGLALKTNGAITWWGADWFGQCAVPAGLSGVKAISAGYEHNLALKDDGTVVAWGRYDEGSLNIPSGLNSVIAISSRYMNNMALKSDGTVVAWGDNSYGQTNVPSGLSGVVAISAGHNHSLVLVPDDTTPPIITPQVVGTVGQNGWYVSDVTLTWTVSDQESEIAPIAGCDAVSITSDQAETAYTCTATSRGGTSSETVNITRDTAPPVVAVTGVNEGNIYVLGEIPQAGCSTSDAMSDVAKNAVLSLSGGHSLGVGQFTATCSGAVDNAGNAGNIAVVDFNSSFLFTGFSAPVDNNGVLNIANAGQTIPLKWRITDANSNPITNLMSVTVTAVSLPCSAGTTTDLIEEYASGGSSLQNLGNGYYQWNWKTPSTYANSCKTLKLNLGEGAGFEHIALFQFK